MIPPTVTNSPLRVLLWSPQGAGLHYSGSGMNAYRMYSRAAHGRFELTLAHGCLFQEQLELFKEQILLAPFEPDRSLSQINFLRQAWIWLRRNHHRFDVFHGLTAFESTIRPALWAQQWGLPAVVKPANQRTGLDSASPWRSILGFQRRRRRALGKLSGVIAISEAIRRDLLTYGTPPQRVFKIPNAVDTERFRPVSLNQKSLLRQALRWKNRSKFLLFVGEISRRKQPDWLIEALPLIQRSTPHTEIAFVGPERETGEISRLKARCRELQITDAVHFHGFSDSIERFYGAADAFCLPSLNEGMPNALLEAMASGLPALATRVSGVEDLIREGQNGHIIHHVDDLGTKASALLENEPEQVRMGSAARETALEYSVELILEQYTQLFTQVAKNRTAVNHGEMFIAPASSQPRGSPSLKHQ